MDEDTYLWSGCEPDFDGLLADEVRRLAGADVARTDLLTAVAQRLRGDLHMPAVRAALGCLIPEQWHPRLDNSKERRCKGAGAERVAACSAVPYRMQPAIVGTTRWSVLMGTWSHTCHTVFARLTCTYTAFLQMLKNSGFYCL